MLESDSFRYTNSKRDLTVRLPLQGGMQGVVQDASQPSGLYSLTSRYGSVRPAENGSLSVAGGHITSVPPTSPFFPHCGEHILPSPYTCPQPALCSDWCHRDRWERQTRAWGAVQDQSANAKRPLRLCCAPSTFLGVTGGVSLNHFLPFLRGSPILVRSDNFTSVAYINLQGGSHFPRLHKLTHSIIMWSSVHLSVSDTGPGQN